MNASSKTPATLNLLTGFQSLPGAPTINGMITFDQTTGTKLWPQFLQAIQAKKNGVSIAALAATAPRVVVPGVAAIGVACAAFLEGLRGCNLPSVAMVTPGRNGQDAGTLDLSSYRHKSVRQWRDELPNGEAFAGWTVFDDSARKYGTVEHPALSGLVEAINEHLRQKAAGQEFWEVAAEDIRIIDLGLPQQRNTERPYEAEDRSTSVIQRLVELADAGEFNKADLVGGRIIYLPAGMATAAVAGASTLYGLAEAWAYTVRISGVAPFAFAELLDIHQLRQDGLMLRSELVDSGELAKAEAVWRTLRGVMEIDVELVDRIRQCLLGNGVEGGTAQVLLDLEKLSA